ncbi:COG6-domain-containing protein [Laetiporus sulphureus 93-53]|uniref:COG6-domain-containing protein n=1 Tax=Laetiporus sulphureus 93-53 TaxID=1314785 RepID=A0A165FEV7_9APHY|nr:COG6-domain-containing protein [Laetiporus sulphureus 93-53]KZT08864.1 COG6-domain-containing protein [Laetiporus sulphureus 93-53]
MARRKLGRYLSLQACLHTLTNLLDNKLDILSATSGYLCCFEFQQMGRDAQLKVSPSMGEAVRRLRHRPELLTEALTYLFQTRQATLLTAFTDALTRGGPGGLPRPIELHAHDPLRYVGDLLAWVHQAIAAEREFLEGLFGVKGDGRMVGSVRTFSQSEEEEWMAELINAAVAKLCTPLKGAADSAVTGKQHHRMVGGDAVLSKALKQMTDMAYQVSFDSINAQGRSLLRIPPDLDDRSVSPPLVILDHAQVLREVMLVYDSSLLGDETEEQLHAGFRDILDKMVDPAIETCLTSAEKKQKLHPGWDKTVFVLISAERHRAIRIHIRKARCHTMFGGSESIATDGGTRV